MALDFPVEALMAPGLVPEPLLQVYAAMRPPWMAEGLCRGQPPEVFFPPRGGSLAPARSLCEACPSREPCLAYSIADATLTGVWGGTTSRERRRCVGSLTPDPSRVLDTQEVTGSNPVRPTR
ncbi:MAG: WhiB family transcriptional regulator [Acidimicrobiia bacterium]|nr:WhiB family transcriptional regulator [Acidimicrobiia bacterium]